MGALPGIFFYMNVTERRNNKPHDSEGRIMKRHIDVHFPVQVVMQLIRPYTRVRIPFISQKLNVPPEEVESLLVGLILDGKVDGHIDQVNQVLKMGDRGEEVRKFNAMDKWAQQLSTMHGIVLGKLQ